ncbi:leucine-rich repeat-containing protein 28 [Nilaparvata lugens]|uniref:leucine-rich repeat-containing protein 28 n=1 Tax=Nilaparvata lugens TaxID=108931 RepID=UPI000B9959D4|nr:leucine-rich repeat-containing protein 28 [Nilaparvata lugens]
MDEELVEEIDRHPILHWNYRGYTSVPGELKVYGTHIEEIYLKQNKLKILPDWIGSLKNLCNLYLNGNCLKDITKEVLQLKNLTVIDISDNNLDKLPDNISDLANLIELRCDNNKLTSLPKKIGFLGALSLLSVENNFLKSLPASLGCCFSLESLNLKRNKLKTLPNNLVFLPQLDTVIISNNQLQYLPSISFVDKPIIDFSKNPCVNYLSYDVFSHALDPHLMKTNLSIFSYTHDTNFQNELKKSDVIKNCNLVVEVVNWKKYASSDNNLETLLVLPEPLKEIYDEADARVPSLFELSLRHFYTSIPSNNRARFFCKKINENNLPNQLKHILMNGPSAICHTCRSFIFTECVVWVIVKLIRCNICGINEILTTVYFCKTSCARSFLTDEKNLEETLSAHKMKWTRVN